MARAASAPMAELLALLTNVHRNPKKHRALAPSDFNPYVMNSRRAGRIPVNAGNIGVLKKAFIKKQSPKRKREGSKRGMRNRTKPHKPQGDAGANPKGIKP